MKQLLFQYLPFFLGCNIVSECDEYLEMEIWANVYSRRGTCAKINELLVFFHSGGDNADFLHNAAGLS